MPIDPTIPLKDFFLKVLTVQKSLQSINNDWLNNVNVSIISHTFTDPFNVDIQDKKDQVDFFNNLLGTDYSVFKWAKKKTSNCHIIIDENNRHNIASEFLSNIYSQLSVPVFEHICIFLKELLQSKSEKSINIINEFEIEFHDQLTEIDIKKIVDTPTIFILHNLRLFRNCITHSGDNFKQLDQSFDEFNRQIEKNSKYEHLKFYGILEKEIFHYSIDENDSKIQLDHSSFLELLDLYSQLAFLAYSCYCNKHQIDAELSTK